MDNLLLTPEPFLTDPKLIKAWLDSMGIKDWSINGGLVDVKADVTLYAKLGELKRLPVRFGKVGGCFYCRDNRLVSLEGAPREVGVDFICYSNRLVSLEGGPDKVGGSFWCHSNRLVNLKGAPKEVGGGFDCGDNQLISLEGAPKKLSGCFWCNHNQLVSLEGAPKAVDGNFRCNHNLLVDFKGMEGISIEGNLYVIAPKIAGQDNTFVSLEGLPKELYGKIRVLDIQTLVAAESHHFDIPDIEI